MNVNIKKLRDSAIMPTKAHKSDAGMDLYVSRCGIENGLFVCHTDIAFGDISYMTVAIDRRSGLLRCP